LGLVFRDGSFACSSLGLAQRPDNRGIFGSYWI
jgi:hypothetical protein